MTPSIRKQVIVLGNSGSGKSTLAIRLAETESLRRLDLDTLAWDPAQVTHLRPEGEVVAELREFIRRPGGWVIEGCYGNLVAPLLDSDVLLVLLDPGLERCLANCRARPWEPHKYPNPEAQAARLPFLLDWVADYYHRQDPLSLAHHTALFQAHHGPKCLLRDAQAFQWPDQPSSATRSASG